MVGCIFCIIYEQNIKGINNGKSYYTGKINICTNEASIGNIVPILKASQHLRILYNIMYTTYVLFAALNSSSPFPHPTASFS